MPQTRRYCPRLDLGRGGKGDSVFLFILLIFFFHHPPGIIVRPSTLVIRDLKTKVRVSCAIAAVAALTRVSSFVLPVCLVPRARQAEIRHVSVFAKLAETDCVRQGKTGLLAQGFTEVVLLFVTRLYCHLGATNIWKSTVEFSLCQLLGHFSVL